MLSYFLFGKRTSSAHTGVCLPRMAFIPIFSLLSSLIWKKKKSCFAEVIPTCNIEKRAILYSIIFQFYIGAWPYALLSCNIVCILYIIILTRYIKSLFKMCCINCQWFLQLIDHLCLLCSAVQFQQHFPEKLHSADMPHFNTHNTQYAFLWNTKFPALFLWLEEIKGKTTIWRIKDNCFMHSKEEKSNFNPLIIHH